MKRKNVKQSKKRNLCNICNKIIIGYAYKFKSHLYQHNAVAPLYECSYCIKQFYRKDAYKRHIATHTGATKKFFCDYCERDFVDKRNLIVHLRIHDDSTLSRKYSCMACGVTYCEERLLKFHIRKEHFNLKTTAATNVHEKMKLNDTWVERVSESEMYVQMTKVNNNIIVIKKCDDAVTKQLEDTKVNIKERDITQDFTAYAHYVLSRNDKSQYSRAICDYCKKEMLKKSLPSHIRERHWKIRKFKCNTCNCSFSRHYLLVDHVCGKVKRRKNNISTKIL
ncbi:zinc finger protein 33A-like [Achroia grisella]|uniref:zinc finger protein 33A-like n=1 Tax=Achroia grisella TaxID=688607 RepID=UPI0027D2E44C|nr:zinc finger protein 33A-like [Achroia grisella]